MGSPTRIVCLGDGLAALGVARACRAAVERGRVELTVVGSGGPLAIPDFFPDVLTGRVRPGLVAVSRRALRPARVRRGIVEATDPVARRLTLRRKPGAAPDELPYDHLVLACEPADARWAEPDVSEHAFRLATYADCLALRDHLLTVLELAELEPDLDERHRLLTFVFVGDGRLGIQVAAELAGYLRGLLAQDYPRLSPAEIRAVVVQSIDATVPGARPEVTALARHRARATARGSFEVRRAVDLVTAGPDEAVLSSGERIPTRTIVLCAGGPPVPLVGSLAFARDATGRIDVDRWGRVPGVLNVWATSAGAATGAGSSPRRHGEQVARNVLRVVAGRPPRPLDGAAPPPCALGGGDAVAWVRGVELTGIPARLVWRALQLESLPGWRRRARLLVDRAVRPLLHPDGFEAEESGRHGVEQVVFDAGRVIVRQGDVGRVLYVILTGEVEVVRDGPAGEELLAVLGPGEHFGEMAVFGNGRRTATVRARSPVRLLALGRTQVHSLSRSFEQFGDAIRRQPGGGR